MTMETQAIYKTKNQQEADSSKGCLQTRVRSRLSLNDIYQGDSFKLCEQIEAKSVDMILEDMPYNITSCEWDTKIDLNLYWETRLRILKPTGAVVLTASQPFTSFLVMSNLKMFKYEWIWKKSHGSFATAKTQPLKRHESVLLFYYTSSIYNPQMEIRKKIRDRRSEGYMKSGGGNSSKSATNPNIKFEYSKNYNPNLSYPKSILEYSNPSDKRLHPTQKPVGLFEYLIRTYTNEGDLVFDGFGGSGTTAIAAHRAKRNFIVIEKDLEYYEKSKKRLEIEQAQQRLF